MSYLNYNCGNFRHPRNRDDWDMLVIGVVLLLVAGYAVCKWLGWL